MTVKHLLLLGSIALAPISSARADNDSNLNERISASACQPRQSSDRSKIAWSGEDWIFAPGEQGTVVLECPIFTDWIDDNTGERQLAELRLWYTDSDGTANHARVHANLRYIDPSAGVIASVSVASVSSNGSATTFPTTRAVSLAGAPMIEAQYFVVITMFRDDLNQAVRFRGVSFFEA